MEKADVVRIRDFLKENHADAIKITADNMEIFNDSNEFVIWDDDNETLYGIRTNSDHYTQVESPINIMTTTYENIQYIEGVFSKANATNIINTMLSNSIISDKQKEILVKYINGINVSNIVPKMDQYPTDNTTRLSNAIMAVSQSIYQPITLSGGFTEGDIVTQIVETTKQTIKDDKIKVAVNKKKYTAPTSISNGEYIFEIDLTIDLFQKSVGPFVQVLLI